MENEEFKIDKLGLYVTYNGLLRECIGILDDEDKTCVFRTPIRFGLLFSDKKGNILPLECPINNVDFFEKYPEKITKYLGTELLKDVENLKSNSNLISKKYKIIVEKIEDEI